MYLPGAGPRQQPRANGLVQPHQVGIRHRCRREHPHHATGMPPHWSSGPSAAFVLWTGMWEGSVAGACAVPAATSAADVTGAVGGAFVQRTCSRRLCACMKVQGVEGTPSQVLCMSSASQHLAAPLRLTFKLTQSMQLEQRTCNTQHTQLDSMIEQHRVHRQLACSIAACMWTEARLTTSSARLLRPRPHPCKTCSSKAKLPEADTPRPRPATAVRNAAMACACVAIYI